MAMQVVNDPRAYRGGLHLAWAPMVPVFISNEPPAGQVSYFTLHVRLNVELESDMDAAILIAEEIIRHQLEQLRA